MKRLILLLAIVLGIAVTVAAQDSPQTARKVVVGVTNEGVTGTTRFRLAKLTGAPSKAIIAATTDTDGVIGIVTANAGTSLNATIQISGQIACDFDGATTAGDYVQISSTTAGKCHDTGAATYPASGQVLGRVLSTNGSSGNYQMVLTGSAKAFGSGFTGSGTANKVTKFTGATALGNSGVNDDGTTVSTTEAVDLSGASSLKPPNSAGAAPTTEGTLAFDTTSHTLEYGENGTNRTVANLDGAQALTNKTINGASNTLTVRIANDVSGLGTGIAGALAVNTGSAGAPVLFNGAGGTPSSIALANGTGLPLSGHTSQATNTIVGNATSGSAAPTALAIGTCSTAGSALKWTTNTGFGCNTAIDAATLGSATFAAPGAIGGGTPAAAAFTTLAATTSVYVGTGSASGGTFKFEADPGISAITRLRLGGNGTATHLAFNVGLDTGVGTLNFEEGATGAVRLSLTQAGAVTVAGTVTAPAFAGTGRVGIYNFNQAAQSQVVVSATEYYVTRSDLDMPATYSTAIAAGTTMNWRIALTKTAAGTGTFQILLKKGTNGSTADTTLVTQTIGTQTAVADNMECDISLTWTSATAAYWTIVPHQSAATGTGFGLVYPAAAAQFTGTISGQTTTTASDKYGLSLIFTTGTPTFVVNMVRAQAFGVN